MTNDQTPVTRESLDDVRRELAEYRQDAKSARAFGNPRLANSMEAMARIIEKMLSSPPPEPAVREDKPAPPGEKFDAEKWAERTITWLANEGAAWIGSTTTDENWGHRMASPEGLAVCRNIMRDNYRAAYAAGLAARDGERVRPTWHTTGRYCCNCGKLLSQHINQRHCHPNKADVYESPSQPPAPEVRP